MGTLIWTDTFDSYATGAIGAPWVNTSNSNVATAQSHSSPNSVAVGTNGNASSCYRPLGSSPSQWYADFWMWTNNSGAGTNQYVAFPPTSGLVTGTASVAVGQTGAGQCGLSNSTSWFTFSVSTTAWHHYLFEVTSAAAGTAKLTVDGTVVGTYSGDTRDTGANAFVAYAWLQGATIGPAPPAEFYVDDLSVYSGTVVVAGSTQARVAILA